MKKLLTASDRQPYDSKNLTQVRRLLIGAIKGDTLAGA